MYIVYIIIVAVIIGSLFGYYHYEKDKRINVLFETIKNDDRDRVSVKALLKKDPGLQNIKDIRGATPLHYAQSYKIAQLFIKGTDINTRDEDGYTPLSQAAFKDHIEIAKLLISEGADVNAKDNDLRTPLHFVKSKEMAQLLIENNADVNARSSVGHTPLHNVFVAQKDWAATISIGGNVTYGDEKLFELVEYLISKGVDVNAKGNRGETSLQKFLIYAKKFELRDETTLKITNFLRKHGAKE
jgi:ankyrin repeat protein